MNITIKPRHDGTYRVTPDHPSHKEHTYGTIYAALDAAKVLVKRHPDKFDTIVLADTSVYVG